MFYFDNTLIIRHIVLIALLLAMGPALHNPESMVENLGFFLLMIILLKFSYFPGLLLRNRARYKKLKNIFLNPRAWSTE